MNSRRPDYDDVEETARYQEYWLNYAIMMKENIEPTEDGIETHTILQQQMEQLDALHRQAEVSQSQSRTQSQSQSPLEDPPSQDPRRPKKRIGLRI